MLGRHRRRHRRWPAVGALALGGLALVCAAAGPSAARAPAQTTPVTVEVSIVDLQFQPGNIEVPTGSTVVWVNRGGSNHTVTAGDGSFDSGTLAPGQQFSKVFDQPGSFSYSCLIHPEMTGGVTVAGTVAPGAAPTAVPELTPAPAQTGEPVTEMAYTGPSDWRVGALGGLVLVAGLATVTAWRTRVSSPALARVGAALRRADALVRVSDDLLPDLPPLLRPRYFSRRPR